MRNAINKVRKVDCKLKAISDIIVTGNNLALYGEGRYMLFRSQCKLSLRLGCSGLRYQMHMEELQLQQRD
jgi:hypothetical protein